MRMGENGKEVNGADLLTPKNWLQESRTVSNLVPSHCPVFPSLLFLCSLN